MTVTIHVGDCIEVLRTLPAESVHCVVTSPPYYGLRDYQTAEWEGGDAECDHVDSSGPVNAPSAKSTLTTNNGKGPKPGDKYHHEATAQYRDTCAKCGATRIDRQIGLEDSPDEYVAKLADVFREVRRVLHPTGTAFLNLGDSYQDKQLQMIPARVAQALQEPYYTGLVKSEIDRAWLAAIIEAEGGFYIHRRKAGSTKYRKNDTYGPNMSVANTNLAMLERCKALYGDRGSIYSSDRGRRRQTIYRWQLMSNEARDLAQEIYPYLIGKRQQARILYGIPSSGKEAKEGWQAIKRLNQGGESTVDYPEPPSLHEKGWYLRSQIIWAKPNAMPESVTDRPTTDYECVYLLAKEARYFYDADAVREEASESTIERNKYGRPRNEHKHFSNGVMHSNEGMPSHFQDMEPNPAGRNKRTVWTIPTRPFSAAHFATFPPDLVEPMIRAGTSERGACPECGCQWERVVAKSEPQPTKDNPNPVLPYAAGSGHNNGTGATTLHMQRESVTVDWQPTCDCDADPVPAVVLDPFAGAGTALMVADRLGRDAIGIELNEDYAQMSARRIYQDAGMFADVQVKEAV